MRNIAAGLLLFLLPSIAVEAQYNVKTFGARGDGRLLDTRFIQQAIDKAYANKGGVVEVPAGTYLIGTLILKDNVELHLQNGAVLLGSPYYKDYTAVQQKYESRTRELYAKYFMIFAEGANNISITGTGTIHGNGLKNFKEERPQNLRPYMVRLVNCENVLIRDVKLLEAGNWTLHLLGCREVNVDGIVIETNAEGNRDGLDIDACHRVKVSNSRFKTTDDAIVLKATSDEICEDIVITNCIVTGCGGSGIKTGTESNGGFRNITVTNCVINNIPVHAGIELMTVDGGMMQNILVDNITMNNVATPFFIRLGIRARPFKPGQYVSRIDAVKDISLTNIIADSATFPSSIIGLHSRPISNVTVSNFTVRYKATQHASAYNAVSFQEFDYPAAVLFEKLPAFALYCRSVEGLHLQHLNLVAVDNEKRNAITLDRVRNAELFSVKANASAMVHLRNAENITAAFCSSMGKALIEKEETVFNLRTANNLLQASQQEIIALPTVPDATVFEDFDTNSKFTIANGRSIKDMTAHNLAEGSLKATMSIPQKGSLQLCLLSMNESRKPAKVLVKYQGITQEFVINWKEWGWAPVTLLKSWPAGEKVDFEIIAAEPGASIGISKLYLRYQDIGFTD